MERERLPEKPKDLPEDLYPMEKVVHGIMRGVMRGILKLDDESKRVVIAEMGKGCAQTARELQKEAGVVWPKGIDMESAAKFMDTLAPHRRTMEQAGDTVIWRAHMKECEFYGGKCMCPLVTQGIVEPRIELCMCSTNWVKDNLEYLTGLSFEGELVESVNTGAPNCVYRFHTKTTLYHTTE